MRNFADKQQSKLHENFTETNWLGYAQHTDRLLEWTTFYRRNLHRFVQHYLGLKMHIYQQIILYLINLNPSFCMVAARAAAKSYIIAVYACAKAILYPRSLIVIASATKGQASLIVAEKIRNEIYRNSYNLQQEIKNIITNANNNEVFFKNGSTIRVVPASDNARGSRATVLIYEEFRQINKTIIETVLSPMLINRQVPYLFLPEYEKMYNELHEEPASIYISSSWFKSHWMWSVMRQSMNNMLDCETSYMICMDWHLQYWYIADNC